jgi:hypothetical protein
MSRLPLPASIAKIAIAFEEVIRFAFLLCLCFVLDIFYSLQVLI